VQCTVDTSSTVTPAFGVTITQCNDSANGGGDLVTCTARITTNVIAPPDTSTTTAPGTTTTLSPTPETTVPTPETTAATQTTFPTVTLPVTGTGTGGTARWAGGFLAAGAAALLLVRRKPSTRQ
jgi:hypothetical protein